MDLIYRQPADFDVVSPGDRSTDRVHLTDILHHIADKINLFGSSSVDFESREMRLKSSMGLAWEEYLSLHKLTKPPYNIVFHFGEVEKDGIVGTPDGVGTVYTNEGEFEAIEEIKCSWFGSKQWDEPEKVFSQKDWWLRLEQVKGYCNMLGLRYGRFWVYHVNGDYKPPRPEFEEFLFRFSETDLKQNWGMILRHKDAVNI